MTVLHGAVGAAWAARSPTFAWRASQQHLLDLVDHVARERGDRRWHLCAPPGAGKTLVGLELARRVGVPTLVLAPTTAIREQWQAATAMFGADPDGFTSDDPDRPAPLLTVTYQLLGNPGDAAKELRAAARRLWVAEVAAAGGLETDVAERRVAATEQGDRPRARRELQRHVRALRRSLGGAEDVGLERATLLGERPLALIERFAGLGIGCVVLDECHHLLDWWALVVAALVERLERDREVTLIGLTATLPDPGSSREAENYRGLLGDVDAELQLAAMVAERTVAPWRDGVRLARVTASERRFLDSWADRFADDLDAWLVDDAVVGWAVRQVTEAALDARALPADGAGGTEVPVAAVEESAEGTGVPARSGAGKRAAGPSASADHADPAGRAPHGGADGAPVPARAALADGAARAEAASVIAGGGATAGPAAAGDAAGWDGFWDRDPITAMALARWWAARGLALPAGFDPPPSARPTAPLTLDDRLVLLHAWLHDPRTDVDPSVRQRVARTTTRHGVALTTAGVRWNRSVADLVCSLSSAKGAAAAEVLAEEAARRGDALRAVVVVERDSATTPSAAVREVLGEDAGTAARVMAALCTRGEVAELGVLLVTGRGAWCDALAAERVAAAVNVASDGGRWVRSEGCDIPGVVRLAGMGGRWSSADWLAAVRTVFAAGAARVLVATRGLVGEGWDERSLNVLVDLSDAASGTAATQLRGRAIRLDPDDVGKVASLWDVAVVHPAAPGDWQRLRRRHARWWGPDGDGRVTTGPAKLHPRIFRPEPPADEELAAINTGSAAAVADRDATLAAWAAVDPGGVAAAAVHVPRARRRRRVRIRSAAWPWQASAASTGALVGSGALVAVAPALWPAAAVVGVGLLAGVVVAVRGRPRDDRTTLLAVAEGVTAGLRAAGRADLDGAGVVVEPDPEGGWSALIDGVSDDTATAWADALAEVLGPLGTPRWMVAVDGRDEAWRVPGAVGATRQAATAFANAVRRRVPASRLVRAGTPRATELVLAAATRRADPLGRSLRWRSHRAAP